MRPKTRTIFPAGFSLVEVVIAIGIVSFALVTIIGLFGGMMKTSAENSSRREIVEAVDALRQLLQGQDFATSYSWVKNSKDLLYVTYRANADGTPNPASQTVAGKWIDPSTESATTYETARSGHWIKGKITVSPSNPGGSSLPATAASYSRTMVAALVTLDAIQNPAQSSTNSLARLETTIAISL